MELHWVRSVLTASYPLVQVRAVDDRTSDGYGHEDDDDELGSALVSASSEDECFANETDRARRKSANEKSVVSVILLFVLSPACHHIRFLRT
jgi:hypothetical protein